MIQKDHTQLIQRDQEESDVVTNEQLRAARALLGWSQAELALRAGLSVPTIKRLEGGFGPHVSDEARAKLKKAIEAAGVEFIEENGGGAGVRFRKAKRR
jgi:transcriptional regulator with XRE-family HTH domain